MKRPMINATLFNVSTEDDEYMELRRHMVWEVTADELDQPAKVLRALLEEYVWRMFTDMEDDTLQYHYDTLMEGKKDEEEVDLPPDSPVRMMVESVKEDK
tara:strand:+ start:495 stop:794 length:300 start_codon:yes stop_codon:yes gene_type:complete